MIAFIATIGHTQQKKLLVMYFPAKATPKGYKP